MLLLLVGELIHVVLFLYCSDTTFIVRNDLETVPQMKNKKPLQFWLVSDQYKQHMYSHRLTHYVIIYLGRCSQTWLSCPYVILLWLLTTWLHYCETKMLLIFIAYTYKCVCYKTFLKELQIITNRNVYDVFKL